MAVVRRKPKHPLNIISPAYFVFSLFINATTGIYFGGSSLSEKFSDGKRRGGWQPAETKNGEPLKNAGAVRTLKSYLAKYFPKWL